MSNVLFPKVRVFAFWMTAMFAPLTGAQTQDFGNTSEPHCGRSSCRELAQVLKSAVSAATQQLDTSRSRLHPHEVHLKGPLSRFFGLVKRKAIELKNALKPRHEDTQTAMGSTGSQQPTREPDTISVYDAPAVDRVRSLTKNALVKGLKRKPDFRPLILSIQEDFPSTPLQVRLRGKNYIEAASADTYLNQKVPTYLSDTSNNGPGPVDLHFTSTPEMGANVALNDSTPYPATTVTEGWIKGLVPGLYPYEVRKNGFKTGSGGLNTKRDRREDVICHLELPASSQPSTCYQTGKGK